MRELIKGAYDLHIHSAPDVLPRLMDDLEMSKRIVESGMAGYAIKSHYFCTSERAEIINKIQSGCDAIGTITLNGSVGGINPTAVEMAARSGAKLVWFPTCDSENEQEFIFGKSHTGKKPYWAQIVMDLNEQGVSTPLINILKDGKLTEKTLQVLDVIAKHDIILATGHLSHEECFAIVPEASKRGVKKIIITHVDFPSTFYTIEEQLQLASYGAVMEHCYTTFASGKVDFDTTLSQIRALGADRVILATDLGQKTGIYPDEGLEIFATKLYENGFTKEDIRKMCVDNCKKLLK